MKTGQRLRAFFSFIFIFIFLFWRGVVGDDVTCQPVQVRLSQSASLTCKIRGNSTVFQSEWTRCNDSSRIVVFNSNHGSTVTEAYVDRVRIQDYHTLNLTWVQKEDFGMYCCKISAFPSGSLEGRVHLRELTGKDPTPLSGSSMMTWIYISSGVAGLIILLLIVIALVCKKKKRKIRNPVHVTLRSASVSPHQPSVLQKDPHTPEDEEDEDGMYLNMKTSP